MDSKKQSSSAEIARILVEFLEASVVFLEGVYPSDAFERGRYMNVVVQRARHPQLRDYIHSSVSGLIQKIGRIGVFILMYSPNSCSIYNGTGGESSCNFLYNIPLERFIFKLTVNQSCGSKMEEAPPGVFSKIILDVDCRWEITAYDSASKDAELWIPTDTKQWQQPPLITPIKSMSSEPLSVQLYLEHPSLSVPKPQEGKNS